MAHVVERWHFRLDLPSTTKLFVMCGCTSRVVLCKVHPPGPWTADERLSGNVTKGVASEAAFDQAFGDPKQVQKQFENYVGRFAFLAMQIDTPNVDVSAFNGGPVSVAGPIQGSAASTYIRQLDLANQRLTAALHENSEYALAHENMAFPKFQQGDDEEAGKEFDEAVKLDPTSYLALYYQATPKLHGKTDADYSSNQVTR